MRTKRKCPKSPRRKISGLRQFYGITEPRSLAYFAVHEEADVRHRAAWREWLATQEVTKTFGCFERGGADSCKALWGALDAVYPEGCVRKN